MFSKMKSIFSRKSEAKSYDNLPDPVMENENPPVAKEEPVTVASTEQVAVAEDDPLAHMRDDPAAHASITSAAVLVMTYMTVNPRKRHLLEEKFSTLVIALSEVSGLTRDQALQIVVKFTSDMVNDLTDEKRDKLIRDIEGVYSEIDFGLPEDVIDPRDFSDRLPDEYRDMLDKHMKFSEWAEAFASLSPFQVGSIGAAAIQEKCAAYVQIHFWNAVIDHMVTSAFMAPEITRDHRVETLKMATKYQDIVRAMARETPDLLKQLEEAWEYTVQHGAKMQEHRDLMFAERQINRWGQPINRDI